MNKENKYFEIDIKNRELKQTESFEPYVDVNLNLKIFPEKITDHFIETGNQYLAESNLKNILYDTIKELVNSGS